MRNDPAPSVVLSTHSSEWFHLYGSLLVLLIAIIMAPHLSKYVAFLSEGHFDTFFIRRCKDTFIDCYVNFLCWSSTYLFIRRYLNPETSSVVFKKFSSDAFYGGLAAASTAFMKPILSAALHTWLPYPTRMTFHCITDINVSYAAWHWLQGDSFCAFIQSTPVPNIVDQMYNLSESTLFQVTNSLLERRSRIVKSFFFFWREVFVFILRLPFLFLMCI